MRGMARGIMGRRWWWWSASVCLFAVSAQEDSTPVSTPGIYPDWPAGDEKRGEIQTTNLGTSYTLLGVGFCRGGPPGGEVATVMVSYVRAQAGQSGSGTPPQSAECFDICSQLERCAGIEVRNSDDWCELQIPTLTRIGDGTDETNTDWETGADAATETSLTGASADATFESINSVAGSPAAATTVKPRSGFYCWGKMVDCTGVPSSDCLGANRYPCEESYKAGHCGPCVPLHVAEDGSNARLPGPATSKCIADPAAVLPTLRVSLGSPWFGGRLHDEALYLAIIYGVKKAWEDDQSTDLIPIDKTKRMAFPMNITGHTDTWGYTLAAEQLSQFSLDSSWDTRIENHPMSGLRAMAALMKDDYTTQYGLDEPADEGRTRPHFIIGSTPYNSLSGVFPHSTVDIPLSQAATFYETPVLGWGFQDKQFSDKVMHRYYLRVNQVGLEYYEPVLALINHYGYKRIGVVTSGTERRFVRGLQESAGANVELWVEDMSLENECGDGIFESKCHMLLIESMQRLKQQDARVVVHEQGALTQLDNYWVIFSGLLRGDTLLIQVGVLGDCTTPMLPPTTGEYGLNVLWENMRKASNMNNRGSWDQMPGQCRVCPNWAFRDLPASELDNFTKVAEYTANRMETIYAFSSFCPEAPTMEDILQCTWCDPKADFWITPACEAELEQMRTELTGTLCVGVQRHKNHAMITTWTDYLKSLSIADIVAAGAPASFFEVFADTHPLYQATGIEMADLWTEVWPRMLQENAALLDSLLLSLVAFNTWVRAAGDSMSDLSATALRSGFRTTHNTAIVNWLATVQKSTFTGLTGEVAFNSFQERRVDYSIYSAVGQHLSFKEVATFAPPTSPGRRLTASSLVFTAQPVFKNGLTVPPPDREPACAPGQQYTKETRGCSFCPAGFYCPGDPEALIRVPAIACGTGEVSTNAGAITCVKCPLGTIPSDDAQTCVACITGRHASEPGSPFCSLCPAGKYWQSRLANDAALALMGGLSNVSHCEACSRGTYQEKLGQTTCNSCDASQDTQTIASTSADDCLCSQGKYLPLDQNLGCQSCPMGMLCEIGSDMRNYHGQTVEGGNGNFPRLLPRFWSTQEEPLSIYKCLNSNACPGALPGECGHGTTGLVCGKCPDGTYQAEETCVACTSVETSKLVFPVLPCIMSIPLIMFLYTISRTPVSRWSSPKTGLICCAAVMMIHFQIQGLLWTFNLYFPASLGYTWGRFAELVNIASVMRTRCAGVTSFEENYYLNVISPVWFAVCFLVTFALSRMCNFICRNCENKGPVIATATHVMDPNYLFSVFGALMETFFVAIAKISLSLFHCYEHPNEKHSLFIAPEVLCDSDTRQNLLVVGVLSILLYVVGGSAVMLYGLWKAPSNFEDESFRRRWRFLLSKYRPDVHYWSAFILVRALLITLATIVFDAGYSQLLYVIMIMGCYGWAVNQLRPWRHSLTNQFDTLMSAALVAAASAMFRFSASPTDPEAQERVNNLVTTYTQATNFIPQGLAVVVGAYMVWQHFHPEIQAKNDERLAIELERVAVTLASYGTGFKTLKNDIAILSEMDKRSLEQAVHILISESNIRLFNLRRSLGLSENIEQGQIEGIRSSFQRDSKSAVVENGDCKLAQQSTLASTIASSNGNGKAVDDDTCAEEEGMVGASPGFVRVLSRDANSLLGGSLSSRSMPTRMEG